MTTIIENPTTLPTARDWTATAAEIGLLAQPNVAQRDRDGTLPVDVLEAARAAGLTTALVPLDHGGGGATHAEVGAALRELARFDPSAAVTLSMHSHLVAFQVWRHKHGQDASAFFQKVVGGAFLVSTGASDWVSSSGSATKVEGGYRVTARKQPASGAEMGDIAVTSIRWEQPGEAPQVLHCAIPFAADGVRVEQSWDTLGLRATGSHTVVFEDVFVPDAAVSLVRPADVWHPVWNIVMGAAMPLIMSAYAGIADEAVATALEMVSGRDEDHMAQLAGEMVTAHLTGIDAVEAMLASSQDLTFDNTDESSSRLLARKATAADAFVQTVRLAVELTGGRGFSRSTDLERLYRDVHGVLFHPLPRARQSRFTGRVALGHSPVG